MAHKDEEISVLSDKIQSLTRDLALDQAELDLLAESEGGLMELSKNINLTTEQAKVYHEEYCYKYNQPHIQLSFSRLVARAETLCPLG